MAKLVSKEWYERPWGREREEKSELDCLSEIDRAEIRVFIEEVARKLYRAASENAGWQG